MDLANIIDILVNRYTLSELEDRLDVEIADFNDGIEEFVVEWYDRVVDILDEDGWLG